MKLLIVGLKALLIVAIVAVMVAACADFFLPSLATAQYVINPLGQIETPKDKLIGRTLKDGKLLLDFRVDTTHYYPEGIQFSSREWREVYACSNGVVTLETNIAIPFTPAQTVTTPERIEFPK